MGKPWYITLDGHKVGPVSAAKLRKLAAEGHVKPTDLVWQEGMAAWISASRLKGLLADQDGVSRSPQLPADDQVKSKEPSGQQQAIPADGRSPVRRQRGDTTGPKPQTPPSPRCPKCGGATKWFVSSWYCKKWPRCDGQIEYQGNRPPSADSAIRRVSRLVTSLDGATAPATSRPRERGAEVHHPRAEHDQGPRHVRRDEPRCGHEMPASVTRQEVSPTPFDDMPQGGDASANNQGRVRSDNVAPLECDGLLFRSRPEIHLYAALKSLAAPFAPLPVFIKGGEEYRRAEPDFVIIKRGIVLIVEVDGTRTHPESPVEAHQRTAMFVHEGAHVERIKACECDSPEKAVGCAIRLLELVDYIKSNR